VRFFLLSELPEIHGQGKAGRRARPVVRRKTSPVGHDFGHVVGVPGQESPCTGRERTESTVIRFGITAEEYGKACPSASASRVSCTNRRPC